MRGKTNSYSEERRREILTYPTSTNTIIRISVMDILDDVESFPIPFESGESKNLRRRRTTNNQSINQLRDSGEERRREE